MKSLLQAICKSFIILSLPVFIFSCEKPDFGQNQEPWDEAVTDFDADYHFYVTMGTMPSLYAGLHALSHDKPSYMFYARPATFDKTKFPGHIELFDYTLPEGETDAGTPVLLEMCEWMKGKIKDINESHPEATFALYVDDIRSRIGYFWFSELGIAPERVKVTMLSDGNWTYQTFYDEFGSSLKGKKAWNRYVEEIMELDWEKGSTNDPCKGTIEELNGNTRWCYYLSCHPRFRYLMHDGSLLETKDSYVKEQMTKMHIWNQSPYQMLDKLSPERYRTFFDMASFDSSEFDRLFDASPKPNLIILGTNPKTDEEKIAEQRNFTRAVYEKYKNSYDIFFKPHPSDKSSENYETEFPGMTRLPRAPFEMFLWKLGNKMDILGGYQTTSLLTCPKEKVKFLFHKGPEDLPKPLDRLFADSDVEWMAK